ncbi:MAG: FtsX-like permease family protein [Clostridia bacterium]|nr:FtsX-like permease family protein [Clostridia bacterium]MBQ6936979.1 FtsX-like permease family protein [Clostridia bacterium]
MYLNILKKDLKRKKAMNIILLLFIILATMFVASSVNNIINVTTALDSYFEMANAPDYLVATMNKNLVIDIDETVSSAGAVDSYEAENILFLSSNNFIYEDENIITPGGTHLVHSDICMNYFLSDGSILETVEPGEFYMTEAKADALEVDVGDKLIIELNGVKREFVLAGKIKDALFGPNQLSFTRYIISEEDSSVFLSAENTEEYYGGTLVYIYSTNIKTALTQIKPLVNNSILTMDRAFMKFFYIFDMIVVGILLVVSIILIIIAFVVLRFTISFTLSGEFREIGVMKAIGISNFKIRGLYLVKYMGLSVIGAAIGLALSFPFGEMLMSVSSQTIIIGNQSPILVNILCAVLVIAVILLFCYGCTGKVKKMSPIDAIRNGQTGERFRKKSLMSLGKSKLPATPFLALNDIVSSPKRYGIISLTFFLCLSIMLILSATVSTMNSGSLSTTFGWADCDIYLDSKIIMECMMEDGREKLEKHLDDMEQTLEENGIPAKCYQEIMFNLPVSFGENESNISIYQGTGTTMDMYEYTAGTAPKNTDEIAITRIAADKLNANIGDTITIKTIDGDKEYIISAFFQSMNMQGMGIRLHSDEYINYVQAQGGLNTQIMFTDNPDSKEMEGRIEELQRIFPDYENIETCAETVKDMLGVADTLAAVKSLIVILTIVIAALITVLMERSFIAKEQGEIALMKAVGTRNGKIYAYHALRFLFVGMIAVLMGEIFAMPLTHLCIDPIFKMMGMELAVDYSINPVEMFLTFPVIILATTTLSAFFTALYTRKIKSSDTANME